MTPTITPKRKWVGLTIDKKYEILKMKEGKMSQETIAEKYGISLSTVRNIYAHSEEIKKQFESNMVIRSSKICTSWQEIGDIEKFLCQWIMQCRRRNIEVTAADIQRKALELNKKFNIHPNFNASRGWVQNFRERHRITDVDIRRYFPTPTKAAENTFKADFRNHLQDGGCTLKNVYNVIYTQIIWKAVPEETLIFSHAKSTESLKMCEDEVTGLFCANATGCHKLPVLIIGRIAETQSSYNFNTDTFSTVYRSNTSASMDSTIFNQWFEEHFLKSVKERQLRNGRREKTLLLLDNARSLHNLKDLNNKDKFVTVMSFPLDVTQLMQPMNFGIISSFKRMYRKELVKTLMPLPIYETEEEVISLHKELSMWDCCRIVRDAWSYIDDAIMINAWDSLLKHEIIWSVEYAEKKKSDILETVQLLHRLPGCERCNGIGVSNWFKIENTRDIVMKICTDEILRDFETNALDEANIGIVDDEAGPSRLKIPKMS